MTVAGWRARIGFLKPTSHGNALRYWQANAPDGVAFIDATIGYPVNTAPSEDEFVAGLDRARGLSSDLVAAGCEAIVVPGTPPFLMMGPANEERWARDLESQLGVPVTTAMLPHAEALLALGSRNVLAITYYGSSLNEAIVRYLEACDVHVAKVAALNVSTARPRGAGELQTGSHVELNAVDFADVYRHTRRAFLSHQGPIDAIYINGSGWDAEPAVRVLERDLEVPVVWAQHAVAWSVYRGMRINASGTACRLHELWPPVPAVAHPVATVGRPMPDARDATKP